MNTERHIKGAIGVAGDQGGRSGEVILIPKQLRAEWVDLMALDPTLAASAKAVAIVIGAHFNRHRGNTYLRQDTIARHAGLSLRAVQMAIGELELRGYLIIERREIKKAQRADGRRVFGGRGAANTYLPAMGGAQLTMAAGQRLHERVEALIERAQQAARDRRRKHATGCVQPDENARNGMRANQDLSTQNTTGKHAPECVPTLTHPSDENPYARGRAGARGLAPAHPLARCEPALMAWLGEGVVLTWFADASVERVDPADGGTLVLGTPNKFNRSWIETHFRIPLLECWNRSSPPSERVERVEIVVRK